MDSVQQFRAKRADALTYIQSCTEVVPEYLVILGTGLGQLAEEMDVTDTIPYNKIPHFPVSTVESHAGRLLFGQLGGKTVVAMQGRFHYYEGYTMQQIAFPVRVLKELGARTLFVSNAAGGMNPHYAQGDIMMITDHINMLGDNPLIGPNDDQLGVRFPDMSEPYSERLRDIAKTVAMDHQIEMHQGVYIALSGPALETKAEYRYLRMLGGDVVGMSTVPEVITAVHMGMEVLGISAVTDECFPDALEPVNIEMILKAAAVAEPKLSRVIAGTLERL